jgi:hypothetical protein
VSSVASSSTLDRRLMALLWLSVAAAVAAIATTPRSRSSRRCTIACGYATVFAHVEPLEDPRSFDDVTLDRAASPSR